jgi:hypothetical protein
MKTSVKTVGDPAESQTNTPEQQSKPLPFQPTCSAALHIQYCAKSKIKYECTAEIYDQLISWNSHHILFACKIKIAVTLVFYIGMPR